MVSTHRGKGGPSPSPSSSGAASARVARARALSCWSMLCALLAVCGCNRADAAAGVEFQGIVEFEESVLSFQTGGEVERLLVQRGDSLERGALVAVLSDALERPLREQRVAEVVGARAHLELVRAGARVQDLRGMDGELRTAQAEEAVARTQLERARLLAERNLTTAAAFEEAQARFDAAVGRRVVIQQRASALRSGARQEEIRVAEAAVEATEAALKSIDARLATYELRAPIAGLVVDVDVREGETVTATTPIVVLGDVAHPRVEVFVPQGRVGAIRIGDGVSIAVDGVARSYAGKIEDIGRRTEFTPRFLFSERERPNLVMRVRVRVEDADAQLHAGVPARVTFH